MKNSLFIIRDAKKSDLNDIYSLARILNSYNLPADKKLIAKIIQKSNISFSGKLKDLTKGIYLFVLEDLTKKKVIGCSQIIAKHGVPGKPHLFLTNYIEKRQSSTLKKTIFHKCLRLGSTENGPTEVGGLILDPKYRHRIEKLSRWISYIRFLYIAAHLDRFQPHILAEFLPVFLKNGQSPFWEYFGKKFTHLSYQRADRLSMDNKEFILSLFPRGTIYQDFFPKNVVKYLGQVGRSTIPAAKILQKIGFRYLNQIEPFDGGPYYGTLMRYIPLIKQAKPWKITSHQTKTKEHTFLILNEIKSGIRGMILKTPKSKNSLYLKKRLMHHLNISLSKEVWGVPLK